MGRYLTFSTSHKRKRGKRSRAVSQQFFAGPLTVTIMIIALFSLVSFFFLSQVFSSSTSGFEVSALQADLEDLKEETRKFEVEAAELRSLDAIESSVEQINMVPVADMQFVTVDETTVVFAN